MGMDIEKIYLQSLKPDFSVNREDMRRISDFVESREILSSE